MAKKLKEYYDKDYILMMSDKISSVYPDFDREKFLFETLDKLDSLEFNDRQILIANSLKNSINLPYKKTIDVFYKILGNELSSNIGMFTEGYWLWPIGKFVEIFGYDKFEISTKFIKELTKRFTGEFAMRPIISHNPKKSMDLLIIWSKDDSVNVRRLSSECLRIRLPWAKKQYVALEYFDDYYKILNNLKDDKDKSVQKSVANNLNDLYKEDMEKFEYIIGKWQEGNITDYCKWIIKHGSRTKNKDK